MSISTIADTRVSSRSKAGRVVSSPFLLGAALSALMWFAIAAATTISVSAPVPDLPSAHLTR